MWCQFALPDVTRFFIFCNIAFDLARLFLVALLMQNLYTGDLYEGVLRLLQQAKNPSYGPAGNHGSTKPKRTIITFDTLLTRNYRPS